MSKIERGIMPKTLEHKFDKVYTDKYHVFTMSGEIKPAKRQKIKCSNCEMTESNYEFTINPKRLHRLNYELEQLLNIPEWRQNRNTRAELKDVRSQLAESVIAQDCAAQKIHHQMWLAKVQKERKNK
jgi:hypothetical protein